jgi:hypothetical protein
MATNSRIGNKVSSELRRQDSPATLVDPHPYIGVVKNNIDPTRCGRLQVWIPDLGGNKDDPKNWQTVSYASPFMGTTYTEPANKQNKFGSTNHTYGMWMVPPDIENEVIVIFIAGDPLRGYWIACVNSNLSRYMMPGLASSADVALDGANSSVTGTYTSGTPAPVTEFNEFDPATIDAPSFYRFNKPVHEPQYNILLEQGLQNDTTRGTISSSSQRETPSNVFGISTPGRPFPDNFAYNKDKFQQDLNNNSLTASDYTYATRAGGHVLVMDDGNVTGEDQLIRIRSARGHQIMMHDTKGSLYIAHASGKSWIELTASGSIDVFANGGYNLRSKGSINIHSDNNININAGNAININSGGKTYFNATGFKVLSTTGISLQATGGMDIKSAYLYVDCDAKISILAGDKVAIEGSTILENSGGTVKVKALTPLPVQQFADSVKQDNQYIAQPNSVSSIVTKLPTHEPYGRPDTNSMPSSDTTPGLEPKPTYTGKTDATKTTAGTSVSNPATDKDLRNQPTAYNTIATLNQNQMTAYYAQLGKQQSDNDYTKIGTDGKVGKYQFNYTTLQNLGYVGQACKNNSQMQTNPNVWTGKDGATSLDAFINLTNIQETAIADYTMGNYNAMASNGAITGDLAPEEMAGMLAVGHLLGPNGAYTWRTTGSGVAAGVTGNSYFQMGKFSATILAPKVPALQQG